MRSGARQRRGVVGWEERPGVVADPVGIGLGEVLVVAGGGVGGGVDRAEGEVADGCGVTDRVGVGVVDGAGDCVPDGAVLAVDGGRTAKYRASTATKITMSASVERRIGRLCSRLSIRCARRFGVGRKRSWVGRA